MKLVTMMLLVMVSGCVSTGREFSSRLDWIHKNQTRQDDVRLVLGEPEFVGSNDGTPSWTYGRYRYSLFGSQQVKELKFYWNANQTVQSWSFTSSFPEDVQVVTKVPPGKGAGDVKR